MQGWRKEISGPQTAKLYPNETKFERTRKYVFRLVPAKDLHCVKQFISFLVGRKKEGKNKLTLQQAANNIRDDRNKAVSRSSSSYSCCLVLMLIWKQNQSVVCLSSEAWGKSEQISRSRLYLQIWEMIESKQCEDELINESYYYVI